MATAPGTGTIGPTHSESDTPIGKLAQRLSAGAVRLEKEATWGYVRSLLQELHVPVSSQVLVFSKTSRQRQLISPDTPRAIYFSDDVYVAWVPGTDAIEVSDVDPRSGPRFYTLEQDSPPAFRVQNDCIRCHDGLKTLGVPGYLMGSNYTGPDGTPWFAVEGYRGGHRSPFPVRWGGWYVTGARTGDLHLGNAVLRDKLHPEQLDLAAGANLTDLHDRFDTSRYLSPHSDIVALLVLEHQLRMHNLISRLYRDARDAQLELNHASLDAASNRCTKVSTLRERMAPGAEALLEYLLFRDEAPLKGPIHGSSSFATEFEQSGPRDRRGRSLRQLDLEHRLLRYPCSYLIYSAGFDAFPAEVKEYLWQRLWEILSDQDHSSTYASMVESDRQAVLEILLDTKAEFAAWVRRNAENTSQKQP